MGWAGYCLQSYDLSLRDVQLCSAALGWVCPMRRVCLVMQNDYVEQNYADVFFFYYFLQLPFVST